MIESTDTLPAAIDADCDRLHTRVGQVTCYIAGTGPPLLLLHSINAAASAYEVRPVFEAMTQTHTVYAPDLPGFGRSERSDRHYTIELYVEFVDTMRAIIAGRHDDVPSDLLALSLSCEFATRSVINKPSGCRSLALVSPTGMDRRAPERANNRSGSREAGAVSAVVGIGPIRRALFSVLASAPSIRFFLGKTFGGASVDPGLIDYCIASAQVRGADHAPAAFLSGRLFSNDIHALYRRLRLPVWLAHGTRGDFTDYDGAEFASETKNWHRDVFATGALPQFECRDKFAAAYRRFLNRIR